MKEGIEALPYAQPEQCEDAVSRQGAVDHFRSIIEATDAKEKYNEGFVDGLEFCISHLSTMPFVTPKPEPKTGRWIRWVETKEDRCCVEYIPHCKCSECGTEYEPYFTECVKYCYECGSRMEAER